MRLASETAAQNQPIIRWDTITWMFHEFMKHPGSGKNLSVGVLRAFRSIR